MLTLSFGFKKPQTGDKGSVFFPALETNFQLLNDHTHNGSNSAKLTAASSTVVTQAISSASWASQGDGMYRQTITLPGTLKYDECQIGMKLSTGAQVFPQVEKVSATTYYVYVNDNSLDLTAVYSS